MSTGRKSQLEKFDAKQRKAKAIQHTLQEKKFQEAQSETIEKVAEREMPKVGMKAEDIFAVFGREHMGSFVKMWNNSLSNAISESISPLVQEVKELRVEVEYLREENKKLQEHTVNIEDVVTQTLMSSFKGLMTGITQGMMESQEPVEFELTSFDSHKEEEMSALAKASASLVIKEHEVVDSIPRTAKGINWSYIQENDLVRDVMFNLLAIAEDEGVDISVGKQFKSHGTDFNGAYQRFMIINKGTQGAWKSLVEAYQLNKESLTV